REHRDTVGAERLQHGTVLGRGGRRTVQELLVLALRVVDQGDGRRRQAGEPGDLADVVHAELDYRGAVPGLERQQRERDADVVVQVAAGGERGLAEVGGEDRGDHLLDRRLAVAAGHGDERQVEAAPPAGGDPSERLATVRHQQRRRRGALGPALHGDGSRAPGEGFAAEVVRIEALATQRA